MGLGRGFRWTVVGGGPYRRDQSSQEPTSADRLAEVERTQRLEKERDGRRLIGLTEGQTGSDRQFFYERKQRSTRDGLPDDVKNLVVEYQKNISELRRLLLAMSEK